MKHRKVWANKHDTFEKRIFKAVADWVGTLWIITGGNHDLDMLIKGGKPDEGSQKKFKAIKKVQKRNQQKITKESSA